MENNLYTFWTLLKKYRVIIPIIQRDYAQGREGKEYVRKNFLEQLGKAIGVVECSNDEEKTAKLDFVYGTINDSKMMPLDGQQRLTTLWLLHWYVAYKAEKLNEIKETLKKFSYETRTSSREFCEKLCELEYQETNDIVKVITNQTWFYSVWKQDPTIQSMLRMLSGTTNNESLVDGIEKLFKGKQDFNGYWGTLTKEDCPIHFNFLPLQSNELPVSDDLYIKMNARGKALTDFENFKADLIDWISEDKKVEYASLIDNDWTDVFWKDNPERKIDEIYFAFLNRYFLNVAIINDKIKTKSSIVTEGNEIWSLYGKESNDSGVKYYGFDLYFKLLKDSADLEKIGKVLNWMRQLDNSNIVNYLPEWAKQTFEGFCFIPKYSQDSITTLTQSQRVLFFAVCCYFENEKFDEESFREWMRVSCNLIENTSIGTIDEMIARIRLIKSISQYSHHIYSFLANTPEGFKPNATKEQFDEEVEKAKQILSKRKDEKIIGLDENAIIEAENHAFFNGAIRFLFKNENGDTDWSKYDTKWKNAQDIFNNEGLASSYKNDAIANRIILSYCDDWANQIESYTKHDKYIFGYTGSVWKDNILLKKEYVNPIHHLLIGDGINQTVHLFKDQNRKTAFNRLVNTNIISLWSFENKPDKNYIRWIYSGFCLYPSSEGVILTNLVRDRVIIELIDKNIISLTLGEIINSSPERMLKGWNIGFTYNSYSFRWQHWNCIDMYEGDVKLWDRRAENTIYGTLHTQFNGEGEFKFTDTKSLIAELERCIEEYEKTTNTNNKGV